MDEELERQLWTPERQCVGTSRNGERCRRRPIPGGDICILHGGGAPQVIEAAKRRLLQGRDLAIDCLLNVLTPKPPCVTCGRSDDDRNPVVVRAAQIVLDRTGHHPTLTIQQAEAPNPYADISDDDLVAKLEEMLADAKAKRDEHRAHALPASFDDAYIIDDDDEPDGSAA
jgi:hypothetical protein